MIGREVFIMSNINILCGAVLLTLAGTSSAADTNCGTEKLYLRGTFNNWAASTQFVCTNGKFEVDQTFSANDKFKFDVKGDWSENYGDNNNDGTLERSGGNISAVSAGEYHISVDYVAKTYTVQELGAGFAQVYLRGSNNGWTTVDKMTKTDNVWMIDATFGAADDERFKFDIKGDWSQNYGDDNNDGIVNLSGNNIAITEGEGEYTITLNDQTLAYTVVKKQVPTDDVAVTFTCEKGDTVLGQSVYVVGNTTALGNGGVVSANQVLDSANYPTWSAALLMPINTVIDWKCVIADEGTFEIIKTQPGAANVVVIEDVPVSTMGSFEEVVDPGFAQVYVRGTHNNYAITDQMTKSGNVWSISLEFAATDVERFKFDIEGDWTENYGDNNKDGIAEQFGTDIFITDGAGMYTITFNELTLAYTVTKDSIPDDDVGITFECEKGITEMGQSVYIVGDTETLGNWAIESVDQRLEPVAYPTWGLVFRLPKNTDVQWKCAIVDDNTLEIITLQPGDNNVVMIKEDPLVVVASFESVIEPGFSQIYLRGTNNGWAITDEMVNVGNEWSIEVDFGNTANERFKFDIKGDWSENYGDNNKDGVAELKGGDIFITGGAGTYEITLNDQTLVYTVEKVGGPDPVDEVDVTFTCNKGNTTSGKSVYVVGDHAELGNWKVLSQDQLLGSTNYPTWKSTFALPSNTDINWKCVIADENTLQIEKWQGGSNNTVQIGTADINTSGSF